MALTAKQHAFVDAFDGDGIAAARTAGYSGSDATLANAASRLLENTDVQKALAAREAGPRVTRVDEHVASRGERQAFWTRIMNDGGADMKDRLKASEFLGKSEADFTETVQHKGNVALEVIDPYAKSGGDGE